MILLVKTFIIKFIFKVKNISNLFNEHYNSHSKLKKAQTLGRLVKINKFQIIIKSSVKKCFRVYFPKQKLVFRLQTVFHLLAPTETNPTQCRSVTAKRCDC